MSLIYDTGWCNFQSFTYEDAGFSGTLFDYVGAQYDDAAFCYGVAVSGTDSCNRLRALNPVLPGGRLYGANILGIEMMVLRRCELINAASNPFVDDAGVFIVKGGTTQDTALGGVNKQQDVLYPTTYTAAYYGGPTDLWGQSWTIDDFGSGFGLAFNPQAWKNTSPVQEIRPNINHIQVKIYYEPYSMFEVL